MTTIAYKDGVMAADSRLTTGEEILQGECLKVFYTAAGLIGSCGDADEQFLTEEFLSGFTGPDAIMPTIEKFKVPMRDWQFLVVFEDAPDVVYYVGMSITADGDQSGYFSMQLHEGQGFAIGSGSSYANVAMALGQTAYEAVQTASQFDTCTGGPVYAYTLDTQED